MLIQLGQRSSSFYIFAEMRWASFPLQCHVPHIGYEAARHSRAQVCVCDRGVPPRTGLGHGHAKFQQAQMDHLCRLHCG